MSRLNQKLKFDRRLLRIVATGAIPGRRKKRAKSIHAQHASQKPCEARTASLSQSQLGTEGRTQHDTHVLEILDVVVAALGARREGEEGVPLHAPAADV